MMLAVCWGGAGRPVELAKAQWRERAEARASAMRAFSHDVAVDLPTPTTALDDREE